MLLYDFAFVLRRNWVCVQWLSLAILRCTTHKFAYIPLLCAVHAVEKTSSIAARLFGCVRETGHFPQPNFTHTLFCKPSACWDSFNTSLRKLASASDTKRVFSSLISRLWRSSISRSRARARMHCNACFRACIACIKHAFSQLFMHKRKAGWKSTPLSRVIRFISAARTQCMQIGGEYACTW